MLKIDTFWLLVCILMSRHMVAILDISEVNCLLLCYKIFAIIVIP